jgi:hypothetical protein
LNGADGLQDCDSGPPPVPTAWAGIASNAPLLDPSQVGVCVGVWQGDPLGNGQTAGGGVWVMTATATYNFTPLTPGLDALLGPMSATVYYQY